MNPQKKKRNASSVASEVWEYRRLSEMDAYLFKEGTHSRLYEKFGAHIMEVDGTSGTSFGVWAPHAKKVSIIGDFNDWNKQAHPLIAGDEGTWGGFLPGVPRGARYKYFIESRVGGYRTDKGDPFAFQWETPPATASIVHSDSYEWKDRAWMSQRRKRNAHDAPLSIYEMHMGSWKSGEGGRVEYQVLAPLVADYVNDLGFTHIELLPIMEHPFYGSWGYQTTGFYAPTGRYGRPEDLKYFIDYLHQKNIGVFLDWVPSHFPSDEHGLAFFDGTHLFEPDDARRRIQPDWNSYTFDFTKKEVCSYLTSNACFWLDRYHADGLRVDAVASMLYLDYSRKPGEWTPNVRGGRENLEAIDFLKKMNETVYREFPDVQMTAEESTAWPMVSRPTYAGGLGFGMKWNMGWMHDTLTYFSKDPVFRPFHHDQLTFSILYAFSENFILPLSHDEVVYGKGSLLNKMPKDEWQKLANMRLLLAYFFAHPGKKLLFMGGEFGQWTEWSHEKKLDWNLLEQSPHQGIRRLTQDLARAYRNEPSLHERDFEPDGFEWVEWWDRQAGVVSFLRKTHDAKEDVLVVLNFTPVPRTAYPIHVKRKGVWKEILNTDSADYGGSGQGNLGQVKTREHAQKGIVLSLTLPPLGAIFLKCGE
ncbi:1,4-alpha-glucan branching protein GlgB [Candidatus Micrarchaeota archaeon]|nr:1,4-alpha-glucan branching protein GlgB [Candidatus Micrarchaeota archaeon]